MIELSRVCVDSLNFDQRWSEVVEVINEPLALRALDAGMTRWCESKNLGLWERDRDAWFYSDPNHPRQHLSAPDRNSPDRYRCWGACHYLAPWCGAIGELLMPDRTWLVLIGPEHSVGAGYKELSDNNMSVTIVDILRDQRYPAEAILRMIHNGEMCRPAPVEEAIECFENPKR